MAIGFMYLYSVRKTVAILFTAIYLFGATEASQLLKLPVLIKIPLTRYINMHSMG